MQQHIIDSNLVIPLGVVVEFSVELSSKSTGGLSGIKLKVATIVAISNIIENPAPIINGFFLKLPENITYVLHYFSTSIYTRWEKWSRWAIELHLWDNNNQNYKKNEKNFIWFLELSDKKKFWKKISQVKEKNH